MKTAGFLCFLVLTGCSSVKSHTDTPTSGEINIGVDDSYRPVSDAEVTVFQSLYDKTKIHTRYVTEDSAFIDLQYDSARLIFSSRKLTTQEEDYFHSKKLYPEQVKVATDAVAIIVNNNNPDTLLSVDALSLILAGKDSLWKQVNNASHLNKIDVVFDHDNSTNLNYMRRTFVNGGKFPDYCFAVHSNTEVIEFVSKSVNAIGIIGESWISDDTDSTTIGFMKKVKAVALALHDSKNVSTYFQPYQVYLKTGDYPLCRDMYIISREPYTGLGSGFLAFVASDRGQRIIYKAGILPATVPTHIIKY